MKSKKIISLFAVGLMSLTTSANAAYNLTLCGASPGGLWSMLGAGVDAAVKESHPGSIVTYQTSGGGFANVGLLQQGKCDLALIHDAEAVLARDGKEPFKAPIKTIGLSRSSVEKSMECLPLKGPMFSIVNRFNLM